MEADLDLNHNDILNVDNLDVDGSFVLNGETVHPDNLVVTNAVLRTDTDPANFDFVSSDPDLSNDTDKLALRGNVDTNINGAIDAPLATPRILKDRWLDLPFVEDWGALGDGSNDDLASIQNAINAERRVFFRAANYVVDGGLLLPAKAQLHGFGPANANSTSLTGAAKLLFTGTAGACFANANTAVSMTNMGVFGLSVIASGTYDWMFDLNEALGLTMANVNAQTTNTATGGLRSTKINSSNPSWLNVLQNTTFTLPNGSTARPLDQDWSDSRVYASNLSGGIGSIDRSYGTQYLFCNIERSTGAAGLTLLKQTGVCSSLVMECFIDANANAGILVDVSSDPTSSYSINYIVSKNLFRTVHPTTGVVGTADIVFTNGTGNVYSGGDFSDNQHRVSAVPAVSIVDSEWKNINFGTQSHVNTGATPFDATVTANYFSGYNGQNVPNGPTVGRGSATIYGQNAVAGFFGAPLTSGSAGVQLGALSAAVPFIGASRNAAGTATALRFRTDVTDRLELGAAGTYLRPSVDNALALGGGSNRFSTVYAGTGTINTSDEREKTDIAPIPDAVLDAWAEVEWCQFRFKDGKRLHTGLVAQRVIAVFEKHGLDAADYGLICYDEWEAEPALIDPETGEEVSPAVEAGNRYGIRYEEALAMEAALTRRTIAKLSSS
jgi:hypothetical protein